MYGPRFIDHPSQDAHTQEAAPGSPISLAAMIPKQLPAQAPVQPPPPAFVQTQASALTPQQWLQQMRPQAQAQAAVSAPLPIQTGQFAAEPDTGLPPVMLV